MILFWKTIYVSSKGWGFWNRVPPDDPPGLSPLLSPFSSYAFSPADLVQFHDSQIQPLVSSLGCLIGILFSLTQLLIALPCPKQFHLVFPGRIITTLFIQWLKEKLWRNLRFLSFSSPIFYSLTIAIVSSSSIPPEPSISSSQLLLPT